MQYYFDLEIICNKGNETEWSPIQSTIIQFLLDKSLSNGQVPTKHTVNLFIG